MFGPLMSCYIMSHYIMLPYFTSFHVNLRCFHILTLTESKSKRAGRTNWITVSPLITVFCFRFPEITSNGWSVFYEYGLSKLAWFPCICSSIPSFIEWFVVIGGEWAVVSNRRSLGESDSVFNRDRERKREREKERERERERERKRRFHVEQPVTEQRTAERTDRERNHPPEQNRFSVVNLRTVTDSSPRTVCPPFTAASSNTTRRWTGLSSITERLGSRQKKKKKKWNRIFFSETDGGADLQFFLPSHTHTHTHTQELLLFFFCDNPEEIVSSPHTPASLPLSVADSSLLLLLGVSTSPGRTVSFRPNPSNRV